MIVGLDIGSRLIKAAAITGSRRRPRLAKFAVREVPDGGGSEAIAAVLETMFQEEGLPRDRVHTAIPASDLILREIGVPFSQDDQIRRTLKFEAENAFHGHAIETLLLDHYRISSGTEKSRLLVAAVPKRTMKDHLFLLETLDVDPARVSLDLAALYNVGVWAGLVPEEGSAVLVDVGAVFLSVVVTENGKLRAARSIRLRASGFGLPAPEGQPALPAPGADVADEAASEAAGPDAVSAAPEGAVAAPSGDETSPEPGETGGGTAEKEAFDERIVGRVAAEVGRTILGCRLRSPLRGIWATGGGVGRARIVRALEERLGVPSDDFALGSLLPGSVPPDSDLGVGAIGIALAGLGVDHAPFDFRQEEFRYQRVFERVRRGMLTAVCILYVGLFLFTWFYQRKVESAYHRRNLVMSSQTALLKAIFPYDDLKGPDSWKIIQTKKQQLQEKYEGRATDVKSRLRDFRTMAEAIVDSGANLRFRRFMLRQESSRLEGEAPTEEEVFKFRTALKAKDENLDVASPKIEKDDTGLVKFTIDIKHPKEGRR